MKRILISSIAVVITCAVAQAALWNQAWSGATYASITDPDVGGGGHLNITSLESIHGTDGANTGYFFRMTLDSAGTANNIAYMLNFNTDGNTSTGGHAGNSTYIATGVSGIDKIVDTHYVGGFGSGSHYHTFNDSLPGNVKFDGPNLSDNGGAFEQVTGTQLEWFVPTAKLGEDSGLTVAGSIVFVGETFGEPKPTITYDVTEAFGVVPEPTSMALLALGIVALGLRRRSRG